MPIALPASTNKREEIRNSEMIHITKRENLNLIVTDSGENRGWCDVYLKSFQGWSVTPFRLLRDYSILDSGISDSSFWGCYLYFFLGQPNWWAIKKNVSPFATWDTLAEDYVVLRVPGHRLLEQAGRHVFYRADDQVVIIRGEYRGQAWIDF